MIKNFKYLIAFFLFVECTFANNNDIHYISIQFWSLILSIIIIRNVLIIKQWEGSLFRKNFYRIILPLVSFMISICLGKIGFIPASNMPLIYTLIIMYILHLGLKNSAAKWIDNRASIFENHLLE